MDMKRFFLYAIVIAALVLAGCGGNGNGGVDPANGNGGNGGMTMVTCPDGSMAASLDACPVPAGPTVAGLFEAAQTGREDAAGAATEATEAVTEATEASGKLDVYTVMGDSLMAKRNAESVLAAKTTADNAVTITEGAVSDLERADMDADEYDNSALDSAIAAALEVAEQAVKDATAQSDSDALQTAVQMVTGSDAENLRTSTAIQERVAMAVGMALMADTTSGAIPGSGVRVEHDTVVGSGVGSVAGARTAKLLTADMSDHQGMTWEEIVGSSNVMDTRIGATGSTTAAVKAASVSGMTLTTGQTATDADMMENNGAQSGTLEVGSTVSYKGIPGVVFCEGGDCVVEAVTDAEGNDIGTMKKLTGSWYFTPASPMTWYIKNADGTAYTAEQTFVRFGHWLSENGDNAGLTDINTFAYTNGAGVTEGSHYELDTVNTGPDATTLTDTSAMYTGMAAGMSLQKQLDANGNVVPGTMHSGAFTADVSLEATFGANPTLGGTIYNFESDNMYAVDPNWEVKLQVRPFDGGFDGSSVAESGRTITSGQDGVWSATAYGSGDTVRPTGIFGGFNAHFTDGHAAGAYATRKD